MDLFRQIREAITATPKKPTKILSVTGKVKYNLVDKYVLISAAWIDKQQALAGKLELACFGQITHIFLRECWNYEEIGAFWSVGRPGGLLIEEFAGYCGLNRRAASSREL